MHDWDNLRLLEGHSTNVREHALHLLHGIKEAIEGSSYWDQSTINLSICNEDRVIASLQTPISKSRLYLSWSLLKDLTLEGVLELEQKQFDKYDQAYWEPTVFSIVVPSSGMFRMEANGELLDLKLGEKKAANPRDEVFIAGVHLIYYSIKRI